MGELLERDGYRCSLSISNVVLSATRLLSEVLSRYTMMGNDASLEDFFSSVKLPNY